MAVYGLSVFIETPPHLRKGRKRYIVISFLITTLRALTGSLDMAWHFQQLFPATSAIDYYQLMMRNWRVWYRILSDVSMNLVVLLGEALLVSHWPAFPVHLLISRNIIGLSLLDHLCWVSLGGNTSRMYKHSGVQYVNLFAGNSGKRLT